MIYKRISFSIHITYISRGPTAYIKVCVYEAAGRDRKKEREREEKPPQTPMYVMV